MNSQPEHDREDAWPAAPLRGLGSDGPAPDLQLLAALREQSLRAFAESDSTAAPPPPTTPPLLEIRKPAIFSRAARAGAALVAVAALLAVWLNLGRLPAAGGAPFSEVLARLRSAQSLELRITKQGHTAEVWLRAPGLVRWNDAPGRYRIAAGSRLWRIDEATNTAVAGDSPWFTAADQPLDLLKLWEIGVTDFTALESSLPAGRTTYDGRECLVYRAPLPTKEGPLEIEAYVEPGSYLLRGLVARAASVGRAAGPDAGPPLAELQLTALNPPLDDAKFVVARSLTEDGRIGKVSDAQGVVGLRPLLGQRWTPIYRETLLKPGDWLRTDIRGANAARVRFSSNVELTLGPGTLLECLSPTQARLHTGEAQVNVPRREQAADATAFELLAPRAGGNKFTAPGKTFWRIERDESLVELAKPETWPKWPAGFEGTAVQESLGSLIVRLPDGRNEPLTVGYHKVDVEIRDQIARTTIEESFVNHTDGRLEGVFHFPLPQDASISGFGMWIGNELVEADVVEKQRAREIYETILRERRDPGLLEWTTGNLFKARVFPIEPRSEKRVRIVYTQVLPLGANRYRYAYGLRSDLLRAKPLRELSLTVTIASALPLKQVTCPTHAARLQQAEHSARVEFAAQDYSPERDFEVVCEIDGRQSDVVVVPHRRGADGYLLVQLMPPRAEGNWQREILPDGGPLQLVLLCDTSASMDSEKRRQQAEFVAATLAALGEQDRFQLAATDTATVWLSPEPLAATAEHRSRARDFLDGRISLGWTDLDGALDAALRRAPAGAHVVYIGDGIVTAGDRDPASFVKRLARRFAEQKSAQKEAVAPTFHTVSVGNTHEATVLQGIAAVGGGSSRAITGEQTPQAVALELLNELAQPGWRDLSIEFRGVKVAAVYPEPLPNVAAGTQQILVGRYLPEGKEQAGEVVVSGRRGTEQVRYAAKIRFPDAEEGNSFIPRLWARAHLDHLLQQGTGPTIRDEIIALSEEFHIMTPYTSLLVLETDADRERFGVRRRYEMRDGERFFQQASDDAGFELAQQQMRRAGDRRLGLRREVLRQLAALGRDSRQFSRQPLRLPGQLRLSGLSGPSRQYDDNFGDGLNWGYPGIVTKSGDGTLSLGDFNSYTGGITLNGGTLFRDEAGLDFDSRLDLLSESLVEEWGAIRSETEVFDEQRDKSVGFELKKELSESTLESDADDIMMFGRTSAATSVDFLRQDESRMRGFDVGLGPYEPEGGEQWVGAKRKFNGGGRFEYSPAYTSWLNELFPSLPGRPARAPQPLPDPPTWSAEALAAAKSLSRADALRKLTGGIAIDGVSETFDPIWRRRSSRSGMLTLYSPTAWLTKPASAGGQTVVDYCNARARGVFSLAFLLGQVRASVERELTMPPPTLNDWSLVPLHESYPTFTARVEKAGDAQVRLVLTQRNSTYMQRFLIDTAKHVLLESETLHDGKLANRVRYSDFVEVAGSWWARKIVTTDDAGRKTAETSLDIQALAAQPFAARLQAELAPLAQVQFLRHPFPKLKDARRRATDGSATFDDRIALVMHYGGRQLWDELLRQLDEAEKLAADKPGVRRLRTVVLRAMRRNGPARQRLTDDAKQLVARPQPDELFLADFLIRQDQSVSAPEEQLSLVELLRPVYERQPADAQALTALGDHLLRVDQATGRTEEALALRQTQAEQTPWETHRQTAYAQALLTAGRPAEAYAWLERQLARPVERLEYDDDALRSAYADLYRTQARWTELLAFTAQWIDRKPAAQISYEQHLSALVYNNRLDEANALAEQWLQEACVEGRSAPAVSGRLNAAIHFAHGYVPQLSFQRMDERWQAPLSAVAQFFVLRKEGVSIARQVLGYRFSETEEADRLRAYFLKLLQTDAAKLSAEQWDFLVSQTLTGRFEFADPPAGRRQMEAAELPPAIWEPIAAQLRARWEEARNDDDKQEKHALGETLRNLYAQRFADTELLPFLRRRIPDADATLQSNYQAALFDALLARPWTDDIEREAWDLLKQLSAADKPAARLVAQVSALHRLVDAMLEGRQAAARRQLTDQGELNQLTRTELAKRTAEFRRSALAGLAKRLAAEVPTLEKQQSRLADWVQIELARLRLELDVDLDQVRAFCRAQLGDAPPKPVDLDADDLPAEQQIFDSSAGLLRHRALMTLMNLAARKNAPPEDVAKLLRYFDAGIARDGDDAEAWRNTKYLFLIALDRPDDLERDLRSWIRADAATAPWRQSLALLLAERGKLDEAIPLFEAAEKDGLLTVGDYRLLADWYLARKRRDDRDRALLAVYRQMPENHLNNLIYSLRNHRRQNPGGSGSSELEEQALFAFRALFEKSARPEDYLYLLAEQYQADHDFRLLQMLPDAVIGRSPQQIYSFLSVARERVLVHLRNEAAADEIIARLKSLRAGERTPTDLRALDLLEAVVERQSAEVLNQKGPHVDACLAALQRAFARKWAAGELRAMAGFLSGLGTLPAPALVDEQLRELRALREAAPAAGRERLIVTQELCKLLFWNYGRRPEALQLFEAEIAGYEQARQSRLPHEDNPVLDVYVSMLSDSGQHSAAELVLQKHLERPVHEEQRRWLTERLWHYYNAALEQQGEVSLGKEETLLKNLVAFGLRQIETAANENERAEGLSKLTTTFDIAARRRIAGAAELIKPFVFEQLPRILRRQVSPNQNPFGAQPVEVIRQLLGPRAALQYVVERMEQWPQALEVAGRSAWSEMGGRLDDYRREAAERKIALGDLEPRVLALTVAELQRELRSGESRNRQPYYKHYGRFWGEKAGDFAAAAEKIYRERKASGRRVVYIAAYLRHGLELRARSVEIMLIAQREGILDQSGEVTLIEYLHDDNRYAESIPLLEPLVQARPDTMRYRTLLMQAYFHAERPQQLAELVRQTDEHFHKAGRWTEENIAEFAQGCLNSSLHKSAVGYFEEAIAGRRRRTGERTSDDDALSQWYQQLAWAHAALGQTREAVEAASGAIVCRSPRHDRRRAAVDALRNVLNEAKDLTAYVKQLDDEAARSGQDSPLVRKTIGEVYQRRNDFQRAVEQYKIARGLQPNDREVCQALIACYDALRRPAEGTKELLAQLDFDRHDLKLYEQLVERLNGDEAEAERAATSLIEAGPGEAENHRATAELREKQNRWSEAIAQWREVAQLRRLEPTGLLGLAAAQLHERQWDAARKTLDELQKTDWPARFQDELRKTEQLRRRLPK